MQTSLKVEESNLPRKFDLIPIHEIYNYEDSEDILLKLAASNPLLPRSNVDDTIEWVIAQATAP